MNVRTEFRIDRQRISQQTPKIGRVFRGQRLVGSLDNISRKLVQVLAFKRVVQCAELIENASQGPDITFKAVGLVLEHLGAHVIRSAYALKS